VSNPITEIQDVVYLRSQATAVPGLAGTLALQFVGGTVKLYDDLGNLVATGQAAGAGALVSKVHAGVAAAGPVTLTGAVVGMRVRQVLTVTGGVLVDSSALFESTITVADQIQQSSASDLSGVTYSFLLQS
jgi:hypothetical protein